MILAQEYDGKDASGDSDGGSGGGDVKFWPGHCSMLAQTPQKLRVFADSEPLDHLVKSATGSLKICAVSFGKPARVTWRESVFKCGRYPKRLCAMKYTAGFGGFASFVSQTGYIGPVGGPI